MKYQVGGEQFVTKKAITERCQEILYRVDLGSDVTEDDRRFLLELIKHHPGGYEKMRGGVSAIHVYETEYKTRGFMLRKRKGRNQEDFSFMKCIRALKPFKPRGRLVLPSKREIAFQKEKQIMGINSPNRKWVGLGGDLEASYDGAQYVDIRVKGSETTRLFISKGALENALGLFAPEPICP